TATLTGAIRGWRRNTVLGSPPTSSSAYASQRNASVARSAGRRLDHVRQHAPFVGVGLEIVDVAEILAAELAMALQVEVRAIRDALELALAERELVFDVRARRRVMRELGGLVLAKLEILGANAERHVPL